METNFGTGKTASQPNVGRNIHQTTSFLLDEQVELEDAENLIKEMLRDEELEESLQMENELPPKPPEVLKFPSVSFISPEKKVIVQYIENAVSECSIENFTSVKESQGYCCSGNVNGFNTEDVANKPPEESVSVSENQNDVLESTVELKEPLIPSTKGDGEKWNYILLFKLLMRH